MPNYAQYQQEIKEDIAATLKAAQCQPILFVGSGFSLRYANGPSWEVLLRQLGAMCPLIDKDFAYYKQKYDGDLCKLGSLFAEHYFEWAWSSEGKKHFPPALFSPGMPRDFYFKYAAAEMLASLKLEDSTLSEELAAFKAIGPHAVITTNYDTLLEPIFPKYDVVVGQDVFRTSPLSVGEIFKIHGSIADPSSLVLVQEDYDDFEKDKKYLSAKLLTYFVEHPLLFIGYSASDANIRNVLYDMSRMFKPSMMLIPNIYILQWDKNQNENSYPPREYVLEVGDGVNVRIKSITAKSYEWVYQAFGAGGTMEKVDLKALRSLMARMVNLIRTDIPTKNVQINYAALEKAISDGDSFANLFGVTNLNDPAAANANHPYTATMLTRELKLSHWSKANKLIEQVKKDHGYDIKANDNIYHVRIKSGDAESSAVRKYSANLVALLNKVMLGEEYKLPAHLLAEVHAINDAPVP
ncbi:SIR2 family protein [Polaromonas hydrogenivorans]|uniref:SIR2 family protein n=1 Tax=Polaromonas hydrogenivorans TaxID=335476 RepID=A0AAU7LRV6_9BURK